MSQHFTQEFAPQEGLVKNIQKPFRDEICLNGYWEFKPEESLKQPLTQDSIPKKTPEKGNWEENKLKIPSPWNVNSFTSGKGGDFRSYPSYPDEWNNVKSGWLRKNIKIPHDWYQHRIILHFEAVAGYTRVFVNDNYVGDNFDLFLPFNLDVTEYVNAGDKAEIIVWVGHGSLFNNPGKYGEREHIAGSFWGTHIVGIWQDVYLQKLPEVYIEDVFIKPQVSRDTLELEITIRNTTTNKIESSINGLINAWENLVEEDVQHRSEIRWTLGDQMLTTPEKSLSVEGNETKRLKIVADVNGKLPLWSPENPDLVVLTLKLTGTSMKEDRYYVRFGWREFNIKGKNLCLNGSPIQIKADSWHFMGVPQMSRRYAYAWYRMIKEANGNGVRLHAQVYPRFYLDMADEMGICVLDESSIWFSDAKSRIDSDVYWDGCYSHIKGMVLRDRNHPSIFGWSICNETMPVTSIVFRAPRNLRRRNITEINKWVEIVKETDSTRSWISGDGEFASFTALPTRVLHYIPRILYWFISLFKKPWGVGETGKAYYGTPKQVSKFNGDRSYESQLGRMEGLAREAFDDITTQRKTNACYSSIFNVVWYGLKPLSLGLADTRLKPTVEDGIFFTEFIESKPGYQPERLGPYSTTLNPGYDENIPLYDPWPLYNAVKLAFSNDYRKIKNKWNRKTNNIVKVKRAAKKKRVVWISSEKSSLLKKQFEAVGVRFKLLDMNIKQVIVIDGANPISSQEIISNLLNAMKNGSTILIWNASSPSCELIEKITGKSAFIYARNASSYVITNSHPILRNNRNRSYYFSEITDKPVSIHTIGGNWLNNATILLDACDTDWRNWNQQSEEIKTAQVFRSEMEEKPPGHVIVQKRHGDGELIVSTLDLFSLGKISKRKVRKILWNLGGSLKYSFTIHSKRLNKISNQGNLVYRT